MLNARVSSAVACFGLALICRAAGAQAPAITVELGGAKTYLGDTLTVNLLLDGAGESTDVYLVLLLPDRSFLTYGGTNQPAAPGEIVPFAIQVTLGPATLTALNQPLALPIEEGTYFLLAALAPSGVSIFEEQLAVSAPAAFSFEILRPVKARDGFWRGSFEGLAEAVLEFTVAEAGSVIASGSRATQLPFTCSGGCSGTVTETTLAAQVPITDLAFSIADPIFGVWQGGFESDTEAHGTYSLSGDVGQPCGFCSVAEVNWTAVWIEP
jgi:hypothetical protein